MAEKISSIYAQEVYEAIRLLTDNYGRYSTLLQRLKNRPENSEENKIASETLKTIETAVDELRYYEKHAYIRLQAISSIQKIDLTTVNEKRESLKRTVPIEEEIEELVIEYHKILATKLTESSFVSSASQVNELTGNA